MAPTVKILAALWRWWSYFWGGVVLFLILCVILPHESYNRREEKAFYTNHLLPLAHYVEGFRDIKGRLPTNEEFNEWKNQNYPNSAISYYAGQPEFLQIWGVAGRDFLVGEWQGEWNEYYQSWDQKTWTDRAYLEWKLGRGE